MRQDNLSLSLRGGLIATRSFEWKQRRYSAQFPQKRSLVSMQSRQTGVLHIRLSLRAATHK